MGTMNSRCGCSKTNRNGSRTASYGRALIFTDAVLVDASTAGKAPGTLRAFWRFAVLPSVKTSIFPYHSDRVADFSR